jgi:hypothetical protein
MGFDAERIAERSHVIAPLGQVPRLSVVSAATTISAMIEVHTCAMSANAENAGLQRAMLVAIRAVRLDCGC